MAVGLDNLPTLHPVPGVRVGVSCAGIKTPGRKDLVVFELCSGCCTAAVFTSNKFCAAPVQLAKNHLAQTQPKVLVVNTGNANAGTGKQGLEDASIICKTLAEKIGVELSEVLPFSTGVIGERLPVATIQQGLDHALNNLSQDNWADAAEGILTTDTRPKGASEVVNVNGVSVTITGISKGAGMIKPNMATMLAYIATDAPIAEPALQTLLKEAVEASFNRITVDSDTSTNDACVMVSTGQAAITKLENLDDPAWASFKEATKRIMLQLAQAIIRDAEGATKFVEVAISGAKSKEDALSLAYTIAHSPLVKTALFACDPNWGRILAAVGRAPVSELDVSKVSIFLNDVCIVENGERAAQYTEEAGQMVMNQEEIKISVNLGIGAESDQVWTSDLSHEYVRINAEYRT